MRIRSQQGFTLVEVIVVAGIIAILAGILVPLILKEIDEARITRAHGDIRSVAAAVLVLKKDTGKWPDLDAACARAATFVHGSGDLPAGLAGQGYNQTTSVPLDNYLLTDASGCFGAKWKGPYFPHVSADPWGNAYIVNALSFLGGGGVWVLSAGPDGAVDTPAGANALAGDDVGIMLYSSIVPL